MRNLWMSLDPYMRLPLAVHAGIHPGRAVGAVMEGAAVGIVEDSRNPNIPKGLHVLHPTMGWRECYVSDGTGLQPVDPALAPLSWYLGVLGMTGITAYAGMELILKPKAGETVLVSGASGAVGSIACQLARRHGCRVLGTAGSNSKAEWLRATLHVDAVVNYKTHSVSEFLEKECPKGIDAYFDNVGGSILNAALHAMRPFARAAICGSISQYNDENYRAGPEDFFTIVEKCITLTGFNVGAYMAEAGEIVPELVRLLNAGELIAEETIVEGLDSVPAAFVSIFNSAGRGKMVAKLAD